MNHPTARGPRYRQLPLWRDAQRFLLEVEWAVRAFPRYHTYTQGSDLRRQRMRAGQSWVEMADNGDLRNGRKRRQVQAVWNGPQHTEPRKLPIA